MAINQFGKKRLGQLGGARTKMPRKLPKVSSGAAGEQDAKGGKPGTIAPMQSAEKSPSGGAGEVKGNSAPRGSMMNKGAKKASTASSAGQGMGEVKGNKAPSGGSVSTVRDPNRTTKLF